MEQTMQGNIKGPTTPYKVGVGNFKDMKKLAVRGELSLYDAELIAICT